MAGIDINRTTPGVAELLPREVSEEIWGLTSEESVVMQAARRINLPGGGLTIPVITGEAEADWVAETDEKPVSDAIIESRNMTSYKLAVIETFSTQFLRDLPALYGELALRLPNALGRKFDTTVLHGTSPGTGFDVLSGAASQQVDSQDTIGDLAAALTTVATNGGDSTAWLVSPQLEGLAMTAKDGTGNYAFLRDARSDSGSIGSLFGRPVYKSRAVFDPVPEPDVLGFVGDFGGSAVWGSVEGVQVAITDTATVNKGGIQINLWQRNMFAIRAEIEVGFVATDPTHFVKLTA